MENNILERLLPKHGLSRKCQKILPRIVDLYKRGNSKEGVVDILGHKNRRYVEDVYNRIDKLKKQDEIKNKALKKISGVLGQHPKDLRDDVTFADAVIRYSKNFSKLEKKMYDVFNSVNETSKQTLLKRYKDDESVDVRNALRTLVKKQKFYEYLEKIDSP